MCKHNLANQEGEDDVVGPDHLVYHLRLVEAGDGAAAFLAMRGVPLLLVVVLVDALGPQHKRGCGRRRGCGQDMIRE